MKPAEFVAKWSRLQQKETALYASHFDDVCRLVGHATPTEHAARHDPEGKTFSFQTSTVKADGQKGFADVFFRDHFIWEYKGVHADLNKAYRQLQLYREALFNPPLLITSDLRTIHIYSNFTNRPTVETVVTLDDISAGDGGAGDGGAGPGVDVLRRVFFHPDSFRPDATRETITRATADTFLSVAEALQPDLAQGFQIDALRLRLEMERAFGGSDADGAWDWKLAYEAGEAALVLFLRKFGRALLARAGSTAAMLPVLAKVAGLLPTHTRRSEEMERYQQFSTPLPMGLAALAAAQITPRDVVPVSYTHLTLPTKRIV